MAMAAVAQSVERVFSDCDFIVPFPTGRTVEVGCIELLIRPYGIAGSLLSPCTNRGRIVIFGYFDKVNRFDSYTGFFFPVPKDGNSEYRFYRTLIFYLFPKGGVLNVKV